MKILALGNCPLDRVLGSGKTRLMWSEGLRSHGHEVDVWEPAHFEAFPGSGRALKLRLAWGAWSALKKIDAAKYDLIEFYGDEFWLPIWRLHSRVRRNRPFLVAHTDGLELLAAERSLAFEAGEPRSPRQKFKSWLHRQSYGRVSPLAFTRADGFVTGCELDRDYVMKAGYYRPDRAVVVPPCVDEEYLAVPEPVERPPVVAFMGSWVGRKGLHQLIPVMTRILQRFPEVRFEVFGTGGAEAAVKGAFPEEVRGRITVYKRISNQEIANRLSQARIFFFPSVYEGFGMSLSEAMACGCASVTTPTGFGAELKDGEEAILCGFEDQDAMERSVAKLIEDPAFALSIAKRGWGRVQQLQWKISIGKLEQTYRKWVDEWKLERENK